MPNRIAQFENASLRTTQVQHEKRRHQKGIKEQIPQQVHLNESVLIVSEVGVRVLDVERGFHSAVAVVAALAVVVGLYVHFYFGIFRKWTHSRFFSNSFVG